MNTTALTKLDPQPLAVAPSRMPASEYRAHDGVSKSDLDVFAVCPAKFIATKLGKIKRDETPAMRFGTLLHALVFEGRAEFHEKPEGMTFASKDGKAWRDEHQDLPIVSADEAEELRNIASAIKSHPHAAPLLKQGMAEASLFGIDRESGLNIKGRADFIGKGYIADIKTTANASNRELAKTIANFRYHVQAAMYLRLANQNGLDVSAFYFIAVERGQLPLINVRKISVAAIELGEIQLGKQLRDLAQCFETDTWPDYSGATESPGEIDLPHWCYSDMTGAELICAEEAESTETNDDLTP